MITLFIYFSNPKMLMKKIQRNLNSIELYEQMERIAQNLNDMEIE